MGHRVHIKKLYILRVRHVFFVVSYDACGCSFSLPQQKLLNLGPQCKEKRDLLEGNIVRHAFSTRLNIDCISLLLFVSFEYVLMLTTTRFFL